MLYTEEVEAVAKEAPLCPICGIPEKLLEIRMQPKGGAVAVFHCETEGCENRKFKRETYRFHTSALLKRVKKEILKFKALHPDCHRCPEGERKMEYAFSTIDNEGSLKHMFVCKNCRRVEICEMERSWKPKDSEQ